MLNLIVITISERLIDIFRKAIEEEKDKIPILMPLKSNNYSELVLLDQPVIVYLSKQEIIPQQVKDIAKKLK